MTYSYHQYWVSVVFLIWLLWWNSLCFHFLGGYDPAIDSSREAESIACTYTPQKWTHNMFWCIFDVYLMYILCQFWVVLYKFASVLRRVSACNRFSPARAVDCGVVPPSKVETQKVRKVKWQNCCTKRKETDLTLSSLMIYLVDFTWKLCVYPTLSFKWFVDVPPRREPCFFSET